MPPEIVKALHDAFKKAMADKAYQDVLDRYQMPRVYLNTADFTKYWADAYPRAGEHVKKYIKKD